MNSRRTSCELGRGLISKAFSIRSGNRKKNEMLELVDKHFKRAAMNMFNDLKENMSIIRIEVEVS